MLTPHYVVIVVNHYSIDNEYEIVDAIEETEDFDVVLHYNNDDSDNPYYIYDCDYYGEMCRCIYAVCESMPEYELDGALERVIKAVRDANEGHCNVYVHPRELPPKYVRPRRKHHKRRRHNRRSSRKAA